MRKWLRIITMILVLALCGVQTVEAAETPKTQKLEAPANLKAKTVKAGIKLSWKGTKKARKYMVYCKNKKGWKKIGETQKTNFTWTKVELGKGYKFAVRSCRNGKVSPYSQEIKAMTKGYKWKGKKLTRAAGVVRGPSGKETYYNLRMSGVVRVMKRKGYNYEYWVRSDGVKMFGPYVMVAANLRLRPRGTVVKTTRGLGIVCDTGSFARRNKKQLDIAVRW